MSQDFIAIRCNHCGAVNRVLPSRLKSGPICGKCHEILPPPWTSPVVVTDRTFEDEVTRSPLPVLVDFWAPWCGPCQRMAPVLDELALETAGKLKICKLNTDENQATAARFKIKAIPSLIFFRGGILLDQIPGAVSREAIMSRIGRFLADGPD